MALGKRALAAKEELESLGITWIDGEYKTLDSILNLRCAENHTFLASVNDIRKTKGCPICLEESKKQESDKRIEYLNNLPKKVGKRLLSIDQATINSGYAIYEDGKLIAYGLIALGENKDMVDRMTELESTIYSIIKIAEIDAVALEGVQYQGNPKTLIDLAKLLGVLEQLVIRTIKKKPLVVLAATWKSTCQIKGKRRIEQKSNAQKFVKQNFGKDVSSDVADAICIGFHANKISAINSKPKLLASKIKAF